jgi:hypothetical protein
MAQADIDASERPAVTSVEQAEIKRLRAENRRLQESTLTILRRSNNFRSASWSLADLAGTANSSSLFKPQTLSLHYSVVIFSSGFWLAAEPVQRPAVG